MKITAFLAGDERRRRQVQGWTAVFLLGALLLASSPAMGARPLATEDIGVLDPGSVEIEAAFDVLRADNRDYTYFPSVQFKFGLPLRAEIGALIGHLFLDPHQEHRVGGWGDLFLYLKHQLWPEERNLPGFALKPLVKIPTASSGKGLGSGRTDYGLGGIFSKSFSPVTVHLDVLYSLIGEKEKTDELSAGLAAEVEFARGWTAVGEIRQVNNLNSDRRDDPRGVNFGLKKEVGPAVFDAAVSFGLNSAAPDYGVTVGVTLRLK